MDSQRRQQHALSNRASRESLRHPNVITVGGVDLIYLETWTRALNLFHGYRGHDAGGRASNRPGDDFRRRERQRRRAQPTLTVSLADLDARLERTVMTDAASTFVSAGSAVHQLHIAEWLCALHERCARHSSREREGSPSLTTASVGRSFASRAIADRHAPTTSDARTGGISSSRLGALSARFAGANPHARSSGIHNRNILRRLSDHQPGYFFVQRWWPRRPSSRRTPTPGNMSTEARTRTRSWPLRTVVVAPEALFPFELFKGDTSFKPRAWAVRVTPALNLNYVNVGERNIVNATPEEGATRLRTDAALQEAFGELKLADVSPNYDFVSVRAGIQPFVSDFRGFLFRDTNLGVRLFGNWGRNRNQWNVAYFDQLEKETNSELNLLQRRNQRVVVASYYRQDFLTPGYHFAQFFAGLDHGDGPFDANGSSSTRASRRRTASR